MLTEILWKLIAQLGWRAIANSSKLLSAGVERFGSWTRQFTEFLRKKGILRSRKFTILIARFEGDTHGEYERRIRAHGAPLKGVRFVTRDAIAASRKTYEWTEEQDRRYQIALTYLREGADVVVYGTALDASRVQIEMVAGPRPSDRHTTTVTFQSDGLPPPVLRFLIAALERKVSSQIAHISSANNGKHVTSELSLAKARVRDLLKSDTGAWSKCVSQKVHVAAGRALMLSAKHKGSVAELTESVSLLRESVRLSCAGAQSLALAHTEFILAKALNELGQIASDISALTESHQLLLKLLSSDIASHSATFRSQVIAELVVVAIGLFERMGDEQLLDAADRAALEQIQLSLQRGAHDDFDTACANYASVLYLRWSRAHEARFAELGVQYAGLALRSGRLQRNAPLFASAARHNMAIMKHALALDRTGAERKLLLEESERSFRHALRTRDKRKVPLLWAESEVALAALRVRIAAERARPGAIRWQIIVLAKADRVLRPVKAAHARLAALERRAGAYIALTEFESPCRHLGRALQIYARMLKILHTHGGSSFQIAVVTAAMGEVRAQLGEAKSDVEMLAAASEDYAAAAPLLERYRSEYAQLCRNGIVELARRIDQLKGGRPGLGTV